MLIPVSYTHLDVYKRQPNVPETNEPQKEPNKPETPQKEPSKSEEPEKETEETKTGDTTRRGLYVLLIMLSGFGMYILSLIHICKG